MLSQGSLLHPDPQWLQLTTWRLSGSSLATTTYLYGSSGRSRHHDDHQRAASTLPGGPSVAGAPPGTWFHHKLPFLASWNFSRQAWTTVCLQTLSGDRWLLYRQLPPVVLQTLFRTILSSGISCGVSPPVIHRFPRWDLTKVLNSLTGPPFESLRSTSLHYLSLKAEFLVAIILARRVLELVALLVRLDLCIFHSDRVMLRLDSSFVLKVNTWFHRSQELVLQNFCPDPVHHLERKWHFLDV